MRRLTLTVLLTTAACRAGANAERHCPACPGVELNCPYGARYVVNAEQRCIGWVVCTEQPGTVLVGPPGFDGGC